MARAPVDCGRRGEHRPLSAAGMQRGARPRVVAGAGIRPQPGAPGAAAALPTAGSPRSEARVKQVSSPRQSPGERRSSLQMHRGAEKGKDRGCESEGRSAAPVARAQRRSRSPGGRRRWGSCPFSTGSRFARPRGRHRGAPARQASPASTGTSARGSPGGTPEKLPLRSRRTRVGEMNSPSWGRRPEEPGRRFAPSPRLQSYGLGPTGSQPPRASFWALGR